MPGIFCSAPRAVTALCFCLPGAAFAPGSCSERLFSWMGLQGVLNRIWHSGIQLLGLCVVCDTGWILTNTSVHAFICFALHESYLRLVLCLSFLKALWKSFPLGCPFLLFCLVFWSPDWFPFCDNKVWRNYWSFWELCDPDGCVSFSVHIMMQSMKRDGLLGMSIKYCQPTASQDGENLVLTLLLVVGIFMMQMVWVWFFFVVLFYT